MYTYVANMGNRKIVWFSEFLLGGGKKKGYFSCSLLLLYLRMPSTKSLRQQCRYGRGWHNSCLGSGSHHHGLGELPTDHEHTVRHTSGHADIFCRQLTHSPGMVTKSLCPRFSHMLAEGRKFLFLCCLCCNFQKCLPCTYWLKKKEQLLSVLITP